METKSMSNFESVGYFHQVFGHPKRDTLQTNILSENTKLAQLRINLIAEEVEELQVAIRENDMVEIIDALGDILYVVYGAGHAFGIDLDNNFKMLNPYADLRKDSNFEFCRKIRAALGYDTLSCVQKNILTENPLAVEMHFGFIHSHYLRFKLACVTNNMTEVIASLVDLLFATYAMGQSIGINLDIAFAIVHKSNMTKLCKTEQEAIDTIAHYKTLPGFETINVAYRPSASGPFYAMYNVDTGKILKSKYFEEPNFSVMLQ